MKKQSEPSTMSNTEAYVTECDGKLVLVDPAAEGMIAAVECENRRRAWGACFDTAKQQWDRIEYFANRIEDPAKEVVVLIDVDTEIGAGLAEVLMPGHNWQVYRDRGETPFARGRAARHGIQSLLDSVFPSEGNTLRELDLAVVVVAHNIARVFPIKIKTNGI